MPHPVLSKSLFLKGRQCLRRVWLALNQPPEPEVESEDEWDMREAEGAEVERLAESLFPGIVRIAAAFDDETQAETRTDFASLATRSLQTIAARVPIAQGHFQTDTLRAVFDILDPRGDGWYLWEVKASTSHKTIFDWDLAFQAEVARRSGIQVIGTGVIHLDADYVRGPELDVGALLTREDRTAEVAQLADAVRATITDQLRVLALHDVPLATPGPRCKGNTDSAAGDRPSSCGQLDASGYCGRGLPRHWAGRLPRLQGQKATFVQSMPDPSIVLLDPDSAQPAWTPDQRRMISAVQRGRAEIDTVALRTAMTDLQWPVSYIDFEFDPGMAVPRFEGTRPYSRIPFQWSMLIQRTPGAELERPEPFLYVGDGDPRRAFIDSLLAALPPTGSIVVYFRAAEKTVLDQLGRSLGGQYALAAQQVIARLFDALDVVKAGYYHPDQQGSNSIKKVAPAMLGRGYGDLAVQDGLAAVVAWKRACELTCQPEERERIRQDLLRYCGRDAELMHDLFEEVRRLIGPI